MAIFDETSVPSCAAAAEAGVIEAQYCLGMHYATGRSVPANSVLAHKWLNLAVIGGYEDARSTRSDLAEELSAGEVAEAQRLAREWLQGQRTKIDILFN